MDKDTKKNYQLYGRNDMIMLDEHNKIYGSLGMAEPYIVATKEGETLLLNGAKDDEPFIGLSLYGKSHQNTVAGNQLLDTVNAVNQKFTITGVTVTNNGDGSFTVIGTPTIAEGSVFTYYITEGLVLEEGQYTLSSGIACRIDKKDGTAQYVDNTFTFDSEVDESVYIYWQRDTNNYVDGETIWPMLNIGTTALPWEPYTGGQPSPNPDYPQEIVSVGDDGEIEVTVANDGYVEKGMALSVIKKIALKKGSHIYCKNNIFARIMNAFIIDDPDLIGTSAGVISNGNSLYSYCYNTLGITEIQNSGATITGRAILPQDWGSGVLYRIESDGLYLYYSINNSGYDDSEDCFVWFWDEELSTEREYKSQSLIVSTPDGLPGIPVSSGGNYTDENGQQWISDEVDFKRGKYVKRVRVLNAREERWTDDWNSVFPDESGNTHVFNSIISNKFRGKNAFCTHFRFGAFNNPDNGYDLFSTAKGGGDIGVRASSELASTIEEWNQFIQQNDVIFACALQNPTETDLTPEQITAYQSLHTNYPTTTVMNDSDAGMKAIYKQIENGG